MAGIKIADFFARIGIKADTKELQNFNGQLNGVVGKLKTFAKALVPAVGAAGLGLLISHTLEAAEGLSHVAESLGLTIEQMSALRIAAGLSGTNVELLEASMQRFNRRLGEAVKGTGPAADDFRRLGIKILDVNGRLLPTLDILPTVADAIQRAGSQAERTAIAFSFFGLQGADLLPFLQKGGKELQNFLKQGQQLTLVTQENIDNAKAFNARLMVLKAVFSQVSLKIKLAIVDAFFPLIKSFEQFIRLNREVIRLRLESFINALSAVFKVLANIIGFVGSVGKAFLDIVNTFPKQFAVITAGVVLLTGAFRRLAIATIAALAPELAIGAAISAVILVVQDLIVYLRGGESVIGDLINSADPKLRALGYTLKFLASGILDFFKLIGYLLDRFIESSEIVIGFLMKVGSAIKNLFGSRKDINIKATQETLSQARNLPSSLPFNNGNKVTQVSNNITVKSNPVINVPPGTSEEQLRTISSYLENRTAQLFSQQLTAALAEAPRVE